MKISRLRGAERLADADFADALRERREQDVHDHDAADEQRDRAGAADRRVVHDAVALPLREALRAIEDREVAHAAMISQQDAIHRLFHVLHGLEMGAITTSPFTSRPPDSRASTVVSGV